MTTPPDDIEQSSATTADLIAALMRRLHAAPPGQSPRRIRALTIARRFAIRPHGSADSRKRGVRLLVDVMRRAGVPILSDFGGYYLADTARDHVEYQQFRRRLGLGHLAAAAADRRSVAAGTAGGQLSLYHRIRY
jgi:hypothetical protein